MDILLVLSEITSKSINFSMEFIIYDLLLQVIPASSLTGQLLRRDILMDDKVVSPM